MSTAERPTTGNPLLDAALHYALDRGYPVFPCLPRTKRPLTATGFKAAVRDEEQIRAWWREHPSANIGIPTGLAETFDALDVDKNRFGYESLAALEAEHGELPRGGPRQRSGGGGLHVLFRGDSLHRTTVGAVARGIDVKSNGGYIVVEPSIHPEGGAYAFEDFDEPLPEPPAWLVRLASGQDRARGGPAGGTEEQPKHYAEGERNNALFSLARSLFSKGVPQAGVEAAVRAMNEVICRPPLGDAEVSAILRSAASYGSGSDKDKVGECRFDPDGSPRAELLSALLGADKNFTRIFSKVDSMVFLHRALYLSSRAYAAAWGDQDVMNLVATVARTDDERIDEAGARAILVRAKPMRWRNHAQLLKAIGQVDPDSERMEHAAGSGERQAVLDMLSARFQTPILNVIQYGRDRKIVFFALDVGGAEVYIGSLSQLTASNVSLRDSVALATQGVTLPAKMSGAAWDAVVRSILQVAEVREVAEAEAAVALNGRLARYFEDHVPIVVEEGKQPPVDHVQASLPFQRGGRVYLSNENLFEWSAPVGGVGLDRPSVVATALLLRALGWMPDKVHVYHPDETGRRRQIHRNYWWKITTEYA